MLESLRWLGYLLLAAIVCVVLVFAFYRWRGPSEAQREALALLHKDYKPKQGRNAFPVLWFMDYDVPESEMVAKLNQEIAEVGRRLAGTWEPFEYDPPEAKLPEATADKSRLCSSRAVDCLATVEKDPEAMRSTLAAFPVTLARQKAFEESDFFWNVFSADYRFVFFPSSRDAQRVWISTLALRYVDGDRVGALAGVCRNIAAWRRMHGGVNSLIMEMVAIVDGDGGLRLFGDMLAKMPADAMVPSDCDVALRPIDADDLDRCAVAANELAISDSVAAFFPVKDQTWWDRTVGWVTYDHSQAQAWRAEFGASFCGDAATARMLSDEPLRKEALPRTPWRLECIASISGCMLASYSSFYLDYEKRTLDFAAHLRLAATLVWLRKDAVDQDISAAFEKRPERLRSSGHRSGVDPAEAVLFVENLDPSRNARFELPIPAAMR